jgi:glycosyltransferase involved in cell wall biosynthesis
MTRGRPSLLVLTQYFHPEPNFITQAVAEALAETHDVTVVAAHPNYPSGHFARGTPFWRPVGTVERGVVVWRVPLFPDHGTSIVRRAVSYLSFAFVASLVAPFVCPRPATVWVYNTPFTTPLAALWFRFVIGARVVFTAADLWPESFAATGVVRDGVILRFAAWYSRAINRVAHDVICVTRGIAARYARDGIPADRLHVVRVWVDGCPDEAIAPAPEGQAPRIIYAGNLGAAQPIETVVRAAALLEAAGKGVAFDIFGTGVDEPRLRALAASLGVRSVVFHGAVPPSQAFAASAAATAQIVTLRPSPLFRMTVPSKLYFCFGAAAPILFALEGEGHDLVAGAGGGIAFEALSAESLRDAIESLLSRDAQERRAMSECLVARYNQEFRKSVLLRRYQELLAGDATPAAQPAPIHQEV